MYHPLLIFDGETDHLLTAVLRPGTVHASRGVVGVLKRVVRVLRARWPKVPIELRADSGFAVPALYAWCAPEGIAYTIGLPINPRLEALAAPLLEEAQQQHEQTGEKVRLASEGHYAAESRPQARRVVFKAEVLAKGPNTRFVVTTREDAPLALYNWYVHRGTSEQWIDDLKHGCFADRLSCHRFWANQFRLLLHAAAYWLLDALRRWLCLGGPAASPTEHPAAAAGQDRRLGARARARRGRPPGQQSSRRTALAPPRRPLPIHMHNPGQVLTRRRYVYILLLRNPAIELSRRQGLPCRGSTPTGI